MNSRENLKAKSRSLTTESPESMLQRPTLSPSCQPHVSLCHPLTRLKPFVAGRCVSLTAFLKEISFIKR